MNNKSYRRLWKVHCQNLVCATQRIPKIGIAEKWGPKRLGVHIIPTSWDIHRCPENSRENVISRIFPRIPTNSSKSECRKKWKIMLFLISMFIESDGYIAVLGPSSGCRQHARQHQSPSGIYPDSVIPILIGWWRGSKPNTGRWLVLTSVLITARTGPVKERMVLVDQCYDVTSASSNTFNITHCQNVTVHFQTGASFNMKQDTKQKQCECIVTSTVNITFDIMDYNISQQRTNFVRYICIMFSV